MAYKFSDLLIQTIKETARIEEVARDYVRVSGTSAKPVGDCPECNTPKKITISPGKNIATCFKCNPKNAMNPIAFSMHYGKLSYPEALLRLTHQYNLTHLLEETEPKKIVSSPVKMKAKPVAPVVDEKAMSEHAKPKKVTATVNPNLLKKESFRDKSLKASGITTDMQRGLLIVDDKGPKHELEAFDRYQDGTLDYRKQWAVVDGVDMVMHYVGLDRRRMTYLTEKGNRVKDMVRVRFENPELHVFGGKPIKYLSPSGSGLHLWLPNKLIDDYNRGGVQYKVLGVQEGEKKADAVCQAFPCVGIMGIHSLARKDSALPREFEQITERFETDTVIFFVDGDLFDLGRSLDDSVDSRPRTFANAAKKFRHHFQKFQANGRRLTILLAHPKGVDKSIKGMDDLLQSGLITIEELREAVGNGILGRETEFLQFYDLTLRTDAQIDEIWHLNNHADFCKNYRDVIQAAHPDNFKLGQLVYRFNSAGEIELDQPMTPQETFYEVLNKPRGDGRFVAFYDKKLRQFLEARGFNRYRETLEEYSYIRKDENTIYKLPAMDIRDFVLDFLEASERDDTAINFFMRNHDAYLGDRSFGLLHYEAPLLMRDERTRKFFAFADSIWAVTQNGVEVRPLAQMPGSVWRDSLIQHKPVYQGELFKITKIDKDVVDAARGAYRTLLSQNIGRHTIEITEKGASCVFLQFMLNSSNFYWQKEEAAYKEIWDRMVVVHPDYTEKQLIEVVEGIMEEDSPLTIEERFETQQHLIAKITAIGHMLHTYRSPDHDYWIFAMEGDLVEDQRSEGRSGKSLIPKMLEHVVPVVNLDGRKDPEKDTYYFDRVKESTQIVNIDDAGKHFDVQRLYPRITGPFGVRAMNKGEVMIPYDQSPKGYISSNFNLLGSDGSTRDRFRPLAFSDFYSADRKPQDIHGHLFFWDWDDAQKSMFYTLMAGCVSNYFKCGGVMQAPSERLEMRRWLQELGNFKQWADRTFLVPSANGGVAVRTGYRIPKLVALGKEGSEPWSYNAQNPDVRKYMTEQIFKRKLWIWAMLSGLIINPGKTTTLKMLPEFKGLSYGGDDKSGGQEWFMIMEAKQVETDSPYVKNTPY